jgi:hypothetical protein
MLYLSNEVELSFTTNHWPVNHTYATLGYVRSICVTTNSNILVVYNLYYLRVEIRVLLCPIYVWDVELKTHPVRQYIPFLYGQGLLFKTYMVLRLRFSAEAQILDGDLLTKF